MTRKTKRLLSKTLLIAILTVIALVYIYPVFLMFVNSFKPFGEVIADPIALPKAATLENYTYVIKKIHYLQLLGNNVMITTIGIVGILFFSALAAYI